jgi:hypothetical protein
MLGSGYFLDIEAAEAFIHGECNGNDEDTLAMESV